MKRKVIFMLGGIALSIILSLGSLSNKALASEQGCPVNPIPWHCGYDYVQQNCYWTNQCVIVCYPGTPPCSGY